MKRVVDFSPEAAEDILELFLRFPLLTLKRLAADFKVERGTMAAVLERARKRRCERSVASTRIAQLIDQRKQTQRKRVRWSS